MPPAVNSLLSLPSSSQSVLFAREPPTDSEKDPRAETSELGPPLKEAIGIGLLRGARRQRGKLHEVAAVQGELRDLLRSDDLPERGVGGLHRNSVRNHFNRRRNRGRIQREIHLARFVHLQFLIFGFRWLEARKFHMDGVHPHRQIIDDVVPGLIRLGVAGNTRALRSNRNGGSDDGGAGLICNRSRETADRLSVAR